MSAMKSLFSDIGHAIFSPSDHINQAGNQLIAQNAAKSKKPGNVELKAGDYLNNATGVTYRIIDELGAGHFGSVFKVQRTRDGKIMAMKVQKMKDAKQINEVQKEVGFLKNLRHRNVVSFFEDFGYRQYICIAMEFCGGGTLQAQIKSRKSKGFSTLRVAAYIAQLTDGLKFIHSRNVTHRDLKSENIMMTTDDTIKISDFGCGRQGNFGQENAMTMTGGDMMVLPPEMSHLLQGVPRVGLVGPKYDMWGLGCIVSELVTLQLMRVDRCKRRPLSLDPTQHTAILNEAQIAHDGKFYRLLTQLLEKDPNLRISAADVRQGVSSFVDRRPADNSGSDKLKAECISRAMYKGVSQRDAEAAWAVFVKADVYGKGSIDVGELGSLLFVENIQMNPHQLMKTLDTTGTGQCSFSSFAKWYSTRDQDFVPTVIPDRKATGEKKICEVFRVSLDNYHGLQDEYMKEDSDQSGSITAISMYMILTRLGVNLDFQSLVNSLGGSWQDKNMSFDDILHWQLDWIDWDSKKMRSSPIQRGAGGGGGANQRPPSNSSGQGMGGRPSSNSMGGGNNSMNQMRPSGNSMGSGNNSMRPVPVFAPPAPASDRSSGRRSESDRSSFHGRPSSMQVVSGGPCGRPHSNSGFETDRSNMSDMSGHRQRNPSQLARTWRTGERCEIMRSSGAWIPGEVAEVTENGYMIQYDDGTGCKEIPFKLSTQYLREPAMRRVDSGMRRWGR